MNLKQTAKSKFLFLLLLLILVLPFYLIYFNNTIPFTEGWGIYYVELMKKGLVPYKDFYYYLPPVNLVIDWLFWSLSGGYLLIYRLFRLLERLLMVSLIFLLLSKYFKTQYAFLATFAGAVLGTAVVYDLMGDYNQTSELFVVLLIILVTQYIEQKTAKMRCVLLFFIGFSISLLFFLKQSSGVAAIIIYSLIFCLYSWMNKNTQFIKEMFCVIFGALVPIFVCATYLLYNEALMLFIEQVFLSGSNSKGGLFTILVTSIVSQVKNYPELILFLNFAVICEWYRISEHTQICRNKTSYFRIWIILLLLPLLECVVFYRETAYSFFMWALSNWRLLLILVLVATIVYALLSRIILKKYAKRNALVCSFFSAISIFYVVLYCKQDQIILSLNDTGMFSLLSNGGIVVLFILIYATFYALFKYKQQTTTEYAIYIMLFSGALVSTYAVMMAAGHSTPATRSLFISVPIILAVMLEYKTENNILFKAKNCLITVFIFTVCIISFAQKYSCAYSWWGWTEQPFSVKNQSIDIHGMEGFMVSSEQKKIYEEVVRIVEKNTDNDSIVYGYPYLKIFNLLTEKIEDPGFIPVPFYDVCGDKYAIEEATLLKKNEPDIVIWCDIPSCIETHETMFRDGKELGQRKIIEWFRSVKDTKYEKIGQINNIFVYKKKNGTKPSYTYFEDENRVNTTLEY